MFFLNYSWEKPVLSLYKERPNKGEKEAFAVLKAKSLTISKRDDGIDPEYSGEIGDFFILMGGIDYIQSTQGMSDEYVICWFEDSEDDFRKDFRRLNGVKFPEGIKLASDKDGKKTYKAQFKAANAKLE